MWMPGAKNYAAKVAPPRRKPLREVLKWPSKNLSSLAISARHFTTAKLLKQESSSSRIAITDESPPEVAGAGHDRAVCFGLLMGEQRSVPVPEGEHEPFSAPVLRTVSTT
jgi:hypothetical protein